MSRTLGKKPIAQLPWGSEVPGSSTRRVLGPPSTSLLLCTPHT